MKVGNLVIYSRTAYLSHKCLGIILGKFRGSLCEKPRHNFQDPVWTVYLFEFKKKISDYESRFEVVL